MGGDRVGQLFLLDSFGLWHCSLVLLVMFGQPVMSCILSGLVRGWFSPVWPFDFNFDVLIGVIWACWWGCPRICSNCSHFPGLMGGGLSGLVLWSHAHFSQGFEGMAGCWLACTSSHCRRWERLGGWAIFGRFIRSWTSLPYPSFFVYISITFNLIPRSAGH